MAAELTYRADGNRVFKNPVRRAEEGGGHSITLGFPVCTMHECVGTEAAESVATLLNRGEQFEELVAALKGTERELENVRHGRSDAFALLRALNDASDALAKVDALTREDADAA